MSVSAVTVPPRPKPWAAAVRPDDRVRLEEAWEHVERAVTLLAAIDLRRYRDDKAVKRAVENARGKVGESWSALDRIDKGLPE